MQALAETKEKEKALSPAERRLNSAPTLRMFRPVIPYQAEVIAMLRREWDYALGTPEILLSGSYGSAKSTLMAHLVVTHCLFNRGARACIARRALPDLKKTILAEILEHIHEDLIEGEDYTHNRAENIIRFKNGSEIICITWADKKYKKGRSLKLSCLVIEEMAENSDEDMEAFKTLKARLRRLPHVKENFFIGASNPDAPSHWVYKYFIEPNTGHQQHPTRYVFYSLTEQNPFLDQIYIDQLRQDLTPREADRYLRGQWIELTFDRIYYAYDREKNFSPTDFEVDEQFPIFISWDFNIGEGKPLSVVLFQFIEDHVHIFDEVIVEGMRTLDSCEELNDRGLLGYSTSYVICGDASGKHRDTRNKRSDWDIIKKYFGNFEGLNWIYKVPLSNGPIRKRHNLVNSYCLNDLGEARLTVYKKCKKTDEGLRLVAPKKGSSHLEDDSKDYQHVTTALGYGLIAAVNMQRKIQNKTKQL